jgi:NADH-quinone oxidoreductase subunit L
MNPQLISIFLILPVIGLLLTFFVDNKQERFISLTILSVCWTHFGLFILFMTFWALDGFNPTVVQGPVLYKTAHSEFALKLFFDVTSAVYLGVASFLTVLVSIFSKYYMHRDKGYKRFYNNLLFFFFGINIVLLSGNFETLFIGWEILGITSFFLISFYKDRYLPVKNALKVFSLYRLADIALLLGIWMCHSLFHKNIDFLELPVVMANIHGEGVLLIFIPFVFLIAAWVKSAQMPFTSWLPRAMEGPSTSSAIFYGALSVHIGVFLLIRTYPIWENQLLIKIIIITFALLTSIIATFTARVQSSVKTQIAYSSVAQIALMFIEVALGLHYLALIHFAGNAFLRCYQLLVSPSVLSYMIHDQFFNFVKPVDNYNGGTWDKIKLSIYMTSIKEWNIDSFQYNFLWRPLKIFGNLAGKIGNLTTMAIFTPLFMAGLYFVYHQDMLSAEIKQHYPEIFSFAALLLVSRAFVARQSAIYAWFLVLSSQLFISLSIGFNEQFDFTQVHIYLSGILASSAVGFYCIYRLQSTENIDLDRFHGHSYMYPRLGFVFVIACLGLAGFPITPTFIGEDLLMSHIHKNQLVLVILTSLNFILDGLVVLRIYSRLFLGPHERGYHEIPYKSS